MAVRTRLGQHGFIERAYPVAAGGGTETANLAAVGTNLSVVSPAASAIVSATVDPVNSTLTSVSPSAGLVVTAEINQIENWSAGTLSQSPAFGDDDLTFFNVTRSGRVFSFDARPEGTSGTGHSFLYARTVIWHVTEPTTEIVGSDKYASLSDTPDYTDFRINLTTLFEEFDLGWDTPVPQTITGDVDLTGYALGPQYHVRFMVWPQEDPWINQPRRIADFELQSITGIPRLVLDPHRIYPTFHALASLAPSTLNLSVVSPTVTVAIDATATPVVTTLTAPTITAASNAEAVGTPAPLSTTLVAVEPAATFRLSSAQTPVATTLTVVAPAAEVFVEAALSPVTATLSTAGLTASTEQSEVATVEPVVLTIPTTSWEFSIPTSDASFVNEDGQISNDIFSFQWDYSGSFSAVWASLDHYNSSDTLLNDTIGTTTIITPTVNSSTDSSDGGDTYNAKWIFPSHTTFDIDIDVSAVSFTGGDYVLLHVKGGITAFPNNPPYNMVARFDYTSGLAATPTFRVAPAPAVVSATLTAVEPTITVVVSATVAPVVTTLSTTANSVGTATSAVVAPLSTSLIAVAPEVSFVIPASLAPVATSLSAVAATASFVTDAAFTPIIVTLSPVEPTAVITVPASVSPTQTTLSVPSVAASSDAVAAASLAPVGVTILTTPVQSSFVVTASVDPATITLTSVGPQPTVQTNATVDPVVTTLSVVATTASTSAVKLANVNPVATTLTAVSPTPTYAVKSQIDPVSISLTAVELTATFQTEAALAPVVITLTVADTSVSSDAVKTALPQVQALAITVVEPTPAYITRGNTDSLVLSLDSVEPTIQPYPTIAFVSQITLTLTNPSTLANHPGLGQGSPVPLNHIEWHAIASMRIHRTRSGDLGPKIYLTPDDVASVTLRDPHGNGSTVNVTDGYIRPTFDEGGVWTVDNYEGQIEVLPTVFGPNFGVNHV